MQGEPLLILLTERLWRRAQLSFAIVFADKVIEPGECSINLYLLRFYIMLQPGEFFRAQCASTTLPSWETRDSVADRIFTVELPEELLSWPGLEF